MLLLFACSDPPAPAQEEVPPDPCEWEGEADEVVSNSEELLDALGKERTIALMPGTYEPLVIERKQANEVRLVGACKEGVVFEALDIGIPIEGSGWPGHATLENLTLRGGQVGLLGDQFGFTLSNVDILDADEGIFVAGKKVRLDAEDLFIGWEERESNRGIEAVLGPEVSLRRVTIAGASEVALYLEDTEGTVLIEDLEVRDQPLLGTARGAGLFLADADVSIDGLELHDLHHIGLYVDQSRVRLANASLYNLHTTHPSWNAAGLVLNGGTLDVVDSSLTGTEGSAVQVLEGVFTAERVDFSDNLQTEDQANGGYGLDVAGPEAEAWVSDSGIHNNREIGAVVREGGKLVLKDVEISGTTAGNGLAVGAGVYVADGTLQASGLHIWGTDGLGLAQIGGVATVQDSLIEGVLGNGRAVELSGGELTLVDCRLQDLADAGGVIAGGHLDATRLEVVGVRASEAGLGIGLQIQSSGSAHLQDSLIDGASTIGLSVQYGGVATVDGLEVRNTASDPTGRFAYGVTAFGGASLSGRDLSVHDNRGVGLLIHDATLDLEGLEVWNIGKTLSANAAIGVAVQADSTAELSDAWVHHVSGLGMTSAGGPTLRCTGCLVEEVGFGGFVVEGGQLELVDSVIRGVRPDDSEGGGVGLFVDGRPEGPGGVILSGVRIEECDLAAVYVVQESEVLISHSTLVAGEGVEHGGRLFHGDGLVAIEAQVSLVDSAVSEARVGLFLHGSAVHVQNLQTSDNDIDLWLQSCEGAPESTGELPEGEVCPTYDTLYIDLSMAAYLDETGLEP